jgi:hypothetical protein
VPLRGARSAISDADLTSWVHLNSLLSACLLLLELTRAYSRLPLSAWSRHGINIRRVHLGRVSA